MGIAKACNHLQAAHFSLYLSLISAFSNTLNVIRTKMLHEIGQFPQI